MIPPVSDDAAPEVILRPARPADAEELAGLLTELGYPASPESIALGSLHPKICLARRLSWHPWTIIWSESYRFTASPR